jgi:tetratricopeptide (TPR) repeat protein|tara:strand:+ start:2071 stop:2631 length:561 start_codon:yes stop_codon:yes gene_type:complete
MNKIKKIIFFNLILILINTSLSADTSKKIALENLFIELKNAEHILDAKKTENKIWNIWSEHYNNEKLTKEMALGTKHMSNGNYVAAYKIFTNIIEQDPDWAEAWNKRATVSFLMGNFKDSLKDINQTLIIEPRHFGALSGSGLVYINLNKYEEAIKSYKAAQKIYPLIESGKIIIKLKRLIKELEI